METYTKLGLIQKKNMAIEQLVDYYCQTRKDDYHNGKKLKGINFRKRVHFLVNLILIIDRILSKEKIVIIGDLSSIKNGIPHVFACTHIGGNDIQRTFEVIKTPAYLMLGDPGILYKKVIYEGLKFNGVIPLETADREDRKIAYDRAVELLQNGGNLLIYPEGAWNVSPNEVVMKIFTGTVRIAQQTEADITPIAVEQYQNTFFFNVGKTYVIPKYTKNSVQELTDDLRDKLATLKWEIIQRQNKLDRSSLPDDYLTTFQDEIVGRCNYGYGFSLEDALREKFHDKNIVTEKEVFSFLDTIDIEKKNAFLMPQKLERVKNKI